jgi:hypothetical protein
MRTPLLQVLLFEFSSRHKRESLFIIGRPSLPRQCQVLPIARRSSSLALLVVMLAAFGCGGGGSSASPPPGPPTTVLITVTPPRRAEPDLSEESFRKYCMYGIEQA